MARSRQSRSSLAAGAMTCAALGLGLAACGNQGPTVEVEGQAAVGDVTANLDPGDEVEAKDLLERLTSPGADTLGAFDFDVAVTGSGDGLSVNGAVDLSGESPAMEVTMEVPSMGVVDLLLVEGYAYLAVPGLTPAGSYVEIPATQLEQLGADDLAQTLDVDSLMQTLDSTGAQVTFAGSEEINGNQTDRFELEVDPQAILDEVEAAAGADLGEEFDVDSAKAASYTLWVGQDNLIRQMVVGDEGSALTLTTDNWGQDLQVSRPDPEDVVQMPGFSQ